MTDGRFVDATSKVVQCKALREGLAACSIPLQKLVSGRKLLKRKHPLGALDLRRLAKAADLRAVAVAGGAPAST